MKRYWQWLIYVRPLNLSIIALTQILVFAYLNELNEANEGFPTLLASTLIFSTICAAAAGYVINDIHDTAIDAINKPNKILILSYLGKTNAYLLYFSLLFLALASSFFFDFQIRAIWFSLYQIVIAVLLWLYAKYLKKIALVGNLLVSFLCAMVIMVVLYAHTVALAQSIDNQFIWLYVLFAFLSNLFREIIKDIEDIEGDKSADCKTLPILLGMRTSKWLAIIVMLLLSGIVFLTFGLQQYQWLSSLVIVLIFALIFQTAKANNSTKFHRISQVTKLLMLLGLGYLLL
jgi:4-hydroxybenzoate polyprenyltransferase